MSLTKWFRGVWRRSRSEADMAEEMKMHIESHAADLQRRGVPAPEALRRAHVDFGSRERYKEEQSGRNRDGQRGGEHLPIHGRIAYSVP